MCTAVTMKTDQETTYFGRTMDFSYLLEPELYISPKGYRWNNMLNTHTVQNRYSFMGIGQDISPIVFADGVNEMGIAAAVLYFPGYAQYDPIDLQDSSRVSIAAVEIVKFLLGQCCSLEQVANVLHSIRIVGVKDSVTNNIAPLHWIAADKTGKCIVIEKTAAGLNIMNNPIGVLSNSPDFQWHMTNLRNYMNIAPSQRQENEWNSVKLTPFGQGAGTFGLPGDYTPPARFVRAAYQKSHISLPSNREDAVIACFHIMESVSIPKGIVITDRNTADYTQYTAFIDINEKEYFFKTYDNSQIVSAKMPHIEGTKMISIGKLISHIKIAQIL